MHESSTKFVLCAGIGTAKRTRSENEGIGARRGGSNDLVGTLNALAHSGSKEACVIYKEAKMNLRY